MDACQINLEKMFLLLAAPAPSRGIGNVLGEINGVEFDLTIMDVLMTPSLNGEESVIVMADLNKINPEIGEYGKLWEVGSVIMGCASFESHSFASLILDCSMSDGPTENRTSPYHHSFSTERMSCKASYFIECYFPG